MWETANAPRSACARDDCFTQAWSLGWGRTNDVHSSGFRHRERGVPSWGRWRLTLYSRELCKVHGPMAEGMPVHTRRASEIMSRPQATILAPFKWPKSHPAEASAKVRQLALDRRLMGIGDTTLGERLEPRIERQSLRHKRCFWSKDPHEKRRAAPTTSRMSDLPMCGDDASMCRPAQIGFYNEGRWREGGRVSP